MKAAAVGAFVATVVTLALLYYRRSAELLEVLNSPLAGCPDKLEPGQADLDPEDEMLVLWRYGLN